MFRQFSTAARRLNIVSDLYVSELKAFKPAAVAADAAATSTKPWKLPQPAKIPAVEAENALDEYSASAVEVAAADGKVQEYTPDAWFVFPEEIEPGHAHH